MTNEELAAFIDWEGGVEAAIHHGLHDGTTFDDPETQKLWDAAVTAYTPFEEAESALTAHIGY